MKTAPVLLLALVICCPLACTPQDTEPEASTTAPTLTLRTIDSPAAPGSGEPNLYATDEGTVFLSWIEPAEESSHALRFARLDEDTWSTPQTIAEGSDWFVNWADFPSLVALDDGALAAHYLAKSAESTYAYDVHITRSDDGGSTWKPAIVPHRDGTPTEHGFVSMLPWNDGRLFAIWLDGRNTGGGEGHGGHDAGGGAMTIRAATLAPDGTLSDEAELDARVCDCCQTSAARTTNGIVAAYRDRSDTEIRDISVVRYQNGRWNPPQRLHEDGWEIQGCPVNGPSVAADGDRVAVAWFSAPAEAPRVNVSFSTDAGATFGSPVRVNDSQPLGRVDVVLLPDGAALVSWVENNDEGTAILARRVMPDGTHSDAFKVAETSSARASGFPRMVRAGEHVYFAWTEASDPARLHTAVATIPR